MRCRVISASRVKASNICCSHLRLVARLRSAGLVVSVIPVRTSNGMRYRIDFKALLNAVVWFCLTTVVVVSGVLSVKLKLGI